LTQPGALDYVREVISSAVHQWGYPYLKLDFLYAAALPGRYRDRTQTRAQVLRKGLEAICEVAGPETTLLGCGCPLGSAIGLMDAMRIGADVAPRWRADWKQRAFIFPDEPNMPSTRNALQNTLTRAAMHHRWWANDPDCLLLRPETHLTEAEVQSLATAIALTGGSLLLSDDLPQLPPERLRIAEQLLPLIGETPQVLDWFDAAMPGLLRLDLSNQTGNWHLLATFNWDDQTRDKEIPLERFGLDAGKIYLARSFWDGATDEVASGHLTLKGIPPHGVRLLALRPAPPQSPPFTGGMGSVYLGGNLHISQGLEVETFQVSEKVLKLHIQKPGSSHGQVDLYLPEAPHKVIVNSQSTSWESLAKDIYRLAVSFERHAEVQVCW
jgi:alpha-galactosidase